MTRRTVRLSTTLLVPVLFLLYSCDPQKDALKLFTQQGLTVLKPARDYIALGGLFVVPRNGTPVYLDPYDTLPGTTSGANPFQAVIMKQSASNSIGLNAAVGTLGGLVTIPAGLKFLDSSQVQLGQINSSGTRYTSQMVTALITKPSTSAAIQGQLQDGQGKNTGNRVFVVQELYTSTSLSLKYSKGVGLAAAIEGSAAIPNCSTTSNDASTAQGGSNTGNGTQSAPNNGSVGSGAKTPSSEAKKDAASGGAPTSGANGGSKTTSDDKSNVGISVGACWSDAATLSFQSDKAIPFAVRLNEVVLGPGNNLKVKVTGFQVPDKAMGGPNKDVAGTALINGKNVVTEFAHQSH